MLRIVQTKSGIVRGLPAADPRITSFKGIPFAAPPIGENRWRAPQPAPSWDGVYEALEFAPISLQVRQPLDDNNIYTREWAVEPDIAMSEDCLYLNIWTPAKKANEKLPVFVWYFGGGLQVGHTAEMEFDGERIARRGIIVVTINYRLNAFGFLSHPELTQEAPKAPTNFGHLDQQFATRWVKDNIAAFGGDGDNITIGGQSAGGGSVMNQLTSPQNEGLFQRAIIQSGVFALPYQNTQMHTFHKSLAEAEQEGIQFFEYLGVNSLAEARLLDAVYLRDKAVEYGGFWVTVEDGVFNIGNSFELFLQNKRLMVPTMFGHTSSEFLVSPEANTLDEFYAWAKQQYGELSDMYLALSNIHSGNFQYIKNTATLNSIEYAIRILAEDNTLSAATSPLYYYMFDAHIPGWDNPGTFHSVDLWFFFETLAKCWRPFTGQHYDLAMQMSSYWSNFIKNGDPNGFHITSEMLPTWEPYTSDTPYRMVFADTAELDKKRSQPLMSFLVSHYLNSYNK